MRRTSLGALVLALVPLATSARAQPPSAPAQGLVHQDRNANPTAAYRLLETTLEAAARDVDRYGARPTILARAMSIVMTSMYEAWAPYDGKAVGTALGSTLRRPAAERTQANQELAIGYAVFRALMDLYPEDQAWLAARMKDAGLDPDDTSTDVQTPAGIGNVAARAICTAAHRDGANQLGDEPGSNGKPYADYTGYRPVNSPGAVADPLRWMPIPFTDAEGKTFTPGFLTPHWFKVKPVALERADQFRPAPPPAWGSPQLQNEIREIVEVNANLSLEQKAIVEFMRDGPRSTGQSGHWLRFAQDVSRRDHHTLDQDVKLFFSVANIVHDAFISCWDTKRHYDASRPYWWVRQQYAGQRILGWAGPGKGVTTVTAEEWRPYSPANFVTPPFPGYTSGHATASGAAARILEHFTGSDRFGALGIRQVGALTEEPFTTAQMQARDGQPAGDAQPSKEIRLELPTFSGTAEMAAVSRMWGGYHVRVDNEVGLAVGRQIADYSWPRYRAYFDGTVGRD